MQIGKTIREFGAAALTAVVFGSLAGIGGATHGVGEVLQGNVAVDGLAIDSWTSGPIARDLGGDPGLTVLPTALAAGIVTLVISAAVVAWALLGVRRRRGGLILVALSVGMLVAGGGVGPPVMGVLGGLAGRWNAERRPQWLERRSPDTRRMLARSWPPLFAVAAAAGGFLVFGSTILVYAIDLNRPALFEGTFYVVAVLLLLMMPTAPAYDALGGQVAATQSVSMTAARAITPRG